VLTEKKAVLDKLREEISGDSVYVFGPKKRYKVYGNLGYDHTLDKPWRVMHAVSSATICYVYFSLSDIEGVSENRDLLHIHLKP
jgi:hypothetical protein